MTTSPAADPEGRLAHGRNLVESHEFAAAATVLGGLVDDLEATLAIGGAAPTGTEGRHRVLVRALVGLASARLELDGAEPTDLLTRASDLARRRGHPDLEVVVMRVRAYCQLRVGQTDEALLSFAEAEPLLDQIGARDRAIFLLNRGVLHLGRGSLAASREDLLRAEGEAEVAAAHDLQQKIRHNRGYLAFLEGDLPTALDLMSSPVVDPDTDAAVADLLSDPIARLDRARVLVEAGLVAEADDLLVTALSDLDLAERGQDRGEAHLTRARNALIMGDLGLAATETERARDVFDARGNHPWSARAEFTQLAVAVEELEREAAHGSLSARAHQRAVELVTAIELLLDALAGPTLRSARFMLAEAAMLAEDVDRAEQALAHGGPDEDDSLSVHLRWHRARAGLAVRRGHGDVQAIVAEGLGELSRAQSRLGSIDLRTAVAIHGRELAEIGVADALGRGDPDELHRAVERSHASSTRLAPVRVDATERERGLLGRLRRAEDALWDHDSLEDPAGAERLRREIRELQQALRESGWQRSGPRGQADVCDLPDVQAALADLDAVAASFTSIAGELVVVRLTPDDLDVVRLGPASEVTSLVERLRGDLQALALPGVPEAVTRVARNSLDIALAGLAERLVAPLEDGGRPLVAVPHGDLSLVPWTLLPGRRGHATTTVPCLTEWLRARDRMANPPAAFARGVSAFAGPGLARAADEVGAVVDTWGHGVARVGSDVTGRAVARALATTPVVHLAAHGTHLASSPMFSSVRLADGPIFAHELPADLPARLVVLSACEVGSHTVREGDEPLGMTAALLQAGVTTVVAGLARVRDDAAHDVMVRMHRDLAAGESPAAALATAVAEAHGAEQVVPFACVGAGLVPLV